MCCWKDPSTFGFFTHPKRTYPWVDKELWFFRDLWRGCHGPGCGIIESSLLLQSLWEQLFPHRFRKDYVVFNKKKNECIQGGGLLYGIVINGTNLREQTIYLKSATRIIYWCWPASKEAESQSPQCILYPPIPTQSPNKSRIGIFLENDFGPPPIKSVQNSI